MRCVVCGLEGATPRLTAGGTHYGDACSGPCDVLAWDAFWLRETKDAAHQYDAKHRVYEGKLLLWEWRRQAASVRGVPLAEDYPKSESEKVIDAWIVRNGLEAVARELEQSCKIKP